MTAWLLPALLMGVGIGAVYAGWLQFTVGVCFGVLFMFAANAVNRVHARGVLVRTLIGHQRLSIDGCACGWKVLGASHAEHVTDAYEQELR